MQNLETARQLIDEHCGTITNTSSIYETEAWGKNDQPAFLNQVVELETKYNAKQLIRRILKTEKNMGRVRKEKYGPRIIDIDILFFISSFTWSSYFNPSISLYSSACRAF